MPYSPYGGFGFPQNIQPGTTGYSGVSEASSIDEVRAASVPYGVSLFMMHDGNIFYAKNSQGVIKCFKYEELPIPSNDPQNFVSRAEFNDLKEKYNELIARQYGAAATTAQPIQPTATQPVADVATAQYDTGASQAGALQPDSSNELDQTAGGAIA